MILKPFRKIRVPNADITYGIFAPTINDTYLEENTNTNFRWKQEKMRFLSLFEAIQGFLWLCMSKGCVFIKKYHLLNKAGLNITFGLENQFWEKFIMIPLSRYFRWLQNSPKKTQRFGIRYPFKLWSSKRSSELCGWKRVHFNILMIVILIIKL